MTTNPARDIITRAPYPSPAWCASARSSTTEAAFCTPVSMPEADYNQIRGRRGTEAMIAAHNNVLPGSVRWDGKYRIWRFVASPASAWGVSVNAALDVFWHGEIDPSGYPVWYARRNRAGMRVVKA